MTPIDHAKELRKHFRNESWRIEARIAQGLRDKDKLKAARKYIRDKLHEAYGLGKRDGDAKAAKLQEQINTIHSLVARDGAHPESENGACAIRNLVRLDPIV